MLLPHIPVVRVQSPDRGIIKHHAPSRPDHVMKYRKGESRWRDVLFSNGDLGPSVPGGRLCRDPRLITPDKNEETSLGTCMLDHDSHEFLNQVGQDNLA